MFKKKFILSFKDYDFKGVFFYSVYFIRAFFFGNTELREV